MFNFAFLGFKFAYKFSGVGRKNSNSLHILVDKDVFRLLKAKTKTPKISYTWIEFDKR